MRKFTKPVAVLIGIAMAFSTSSPTSAVGNTADPNADAIIGIDACVTETQLDCIESIATIIDGKVVPGTHTGYLPLPPFTDNNGFNYERGFSQWTVETANGPKAIDIDAELWPLEVGFGSALHLTAQGNESDLTTVYQFKVRTSWIVPANVTIHAGDANFVDQKISGGHRWTLQGTRIETSSYTSNHQQKLKSNAQADIDGSLLDFWVHHAGKPGHTFFPSDCAKAGYTVEASNATSGGQPRWNSSTKSLDFAIQAPHTNTKGELSKGFFKLWVNKAYMKCKWPQSGLDKANEFAVNVYNEDGTKQVATTVISFKNDQLKVAALNFHYSAPKIKLVGKKKVVKKVVKKK